MVSSDILVAFKANDTNGNTLAEFNIKAPEPNLTNPESFQDLFIRI
jgi:hypothetical protein